MPDPPAATGKRIHLKDGRSLGYAEYAVSAGAPVLVFAGTPGSRLLCLPVEPARALGARVMVIERPGFGLPNPQPGRTLPNCQAHFFPGEGHWLLLDHWGEILAALIS